MKRLQLSEIREAVNGRLISGRPERFVEGVSTDTRSIKGGELFVPLRGERFDGHDFITQAVSAGATAVVAEERSLPTGLADTVGLVAVRDTLAALGDLAHYYRGLFGVTVVAVTGSNGKTTTKEMTAHVLGGMGTVVWSPKSFNNFVGVPLTLFGLEDGTDYAVVEMGTSGPGEIARSAGIADPDVGVITNVGGVHLEGLGSIEGVATAKGELLDALGPEDSAILNADDEWSMKLRGRSRARVVTFGLDEKADIRAEAVEADGTGIRFTGPERVKIEVPVLGRHNVYNALAAIAVGRRLGMTMEQIAGRLASFRPPRMRSEVLDVGGVTVLNDSYNANPASMRAALDAFALLSVRGRQHVVLGDMLELGPTSGQLHYELGQELGRRKPDFLWLYGPQMAEAAKAVRAMRVRGTKVRHADTLEKLADEFVQKVESGDGVLIKGSRGMGTERVLELLKKRVGQA